MSQLGLRMDSDGSSGHRKGGGRGRRKKRARRGGGIAVVLAVIAVIALVGGGGYFGVTYVRSQFFAPTPDYTGSGLTSIEVVIPTGATLTQMGQVLQSQGVVKSAAAFTNAAGANPASANIQPGTYLLKTQMKASLAVTALLNPANLDNNSRIIVTGGSRASSVFQEIASKLNVPLATVQAAAQNKQAVGVPSWATAGVEGLLAPGTYNIQPGMTPTQVLTQMVSAGAQRIMDPTVTSAATALNLTPYQIMIMASIVQVEADNPTDYSKVARVILNRIAANMPLQFDSTVLYAEGRSGSLDVSLQDTQFQSPYNTYLHAGLPPGPIGNPDTSAIQAVLNPPQGDWLYFITVNPSTGETDFTNDPKQFAQWKSQFEQYHNAHPSPSPSSS